MRTEKKKYSRIFTSTAGVLLLAVVASLSSCDDDPIVTPTGGDDDDCTGSYCKLEMNKPQKEVAYHKLIKNPTIF